jgi:amino acid transporter
MEETKPEEKKGLIGKLKDAAEDKEHQIEILGTFVRLGVVVWSGFIITMNYVDIPMVKKSGNSDITFVASVFTGALATFGLTTGKNGNGKKPIDCPMAKKPTTKA